MISRVTRPVPAPLFDEVSALFQVDPDPSAEIGDERFFVDNSRRSHRLRPAWGAETAFPDQLDKSLVMAVAVRQTAPGRIQRLAGWSTRDDLASESEESAWVTFDGEILGRRGELAPDRGTQWMRARVQILSQIAEVVQ